MNAREKLQFCEGLFLFLDELLDAFGGKGEQVIELGFGEGGGFGGALDFDESACPIHCDIHVYFGLDIQGIVEI